MGLRRFQDLRRLVRWIKSKVRLTTTWRPTEKEAYLAEDIDEETARELQELKEDATTEEINAVYKRGQQRRVQRGNAHGRRGLPPRERPGGARPPPRAPADVTCPNCLEKGHGAFDCPKPKVKRSDRACFDCGEPGHEARFCPKKKQPVQVLEDNDRPTWCLDDADGFIPVQRRRAASAAGEKKNKTNIAPPLEESGVDTAHARAADAGLVHRRERLGGAERQSRRPHGGRGGHDAPGGRKAPSLHGRKCQGRRQKGALWRS